MNGSNRNTRTKVIFMAAALGAGLGLGGCATRHLGADFGQAVRQDIAAQVANPDARYAGVIAPGSNASRVAAAQDRYAKGKVIQPSTQVAASSVAAAPSTSSGLVQ